MDRARKLLIINEIKPSVHELGGYSCYGIEESVERVAEALDEQVRKCIAVAMICAKDDGYAGGWSARQVAEQIEKELLMGDSNG